MGRRSLQLRAGQLRSGSSAPAILYLTNNLPCPPISGGQLREYQLLRRLSLRFAIHLVAFVTSKAPQEAAEASRGFLASITEVVTKPDAAPAGMPLRMRLHYTPEGAAVVRSVFQRYPFVLVHVEGYFLMHYLECIPKIPVVLTAENIEFALEAQAEALGYKDFNASATMVAEIDAWQRATVCVCVTAEDAEVVRQHVSTVPVQCVTHGVDHLPDILNGERTRSATGRTCLYVANYSWAPSRDAAVHLLRDIWPEICSLVPGSKLILAGCGLDRSLADQAAQTRDVTVYGKFTTFEEVSSLADLFIFPMRFGGGIKAKIIEAISAGLPIVTTAIALRGFPQEVRQFVWLANSAQAFAEMVARALAQAEEQAIRANSAKLLLRSMMPTWTELAGTLAAIWEHAWNDHRATEEHVSCQASHIQ